MRLFLLASLLACAQAQPVRIVLVGDSTVNDQGGWGPGLRASFNAPVEVVNFALNGRSSKSFRDEGAWAKALAAQPNYILIQFGHNDGPGKGPARETDPATTYRENMARYVEETRAAGAEPILVTSIVRRVFTADGKIRRDSLVPYVEQVRALAAEKNVPLIDLYSLTLAQAEGLGADACADIDARDKDGKRDRTHLGPKGREEIGGMAARELVRAVPALAKYYSATTAHVSPTFSKHIAPILYAKCAGCHRPGEIAPMSLLDYHSARPWAKSIREAVISRKMPPWFADPRFGHFANDPRLSDREIATIKAWVDAGSPEGDPHDLPPKPLFTDSWKLGKPDIVVDIGQDFVTTPGRDAYEYFTVPTNFTEGKWIRAAQILPGNRRAVHHVHVSLVLENKADSISSAFRQKSGGYWEVKDGLSRVRMDAPVVNDACSGDPPDDLSLTGFEEGSFTAMLPGKPPDIFGDSTAKYIPAGAKLRFQIHYAKLDQPQTDRTSVGFYLASAPPATPMRRLDLRNRYFLIPPGAESHEVKRCYEFETDKLLVSITPHMHYRGKDARYDLVRPDGSRETLLLVSPYDFNWQLLYKFQQPVRVPKGSRIEVTFRYNNSPNLPGNPDPNHPVRWGDRSEDEMMTSWIEYLDAKPASIQ